MDAQKKNTVFEHAASCARLNKCISTASSGKLRTLLRQSCREINAVYRLVESRFASAASMPDSCRWLLDNRYLVIRQARAVMPELRRQRRLRSGQRGSASCRRVPRHDKRL